MKHVLFYLLPSAMSEKLHLISTQDTKQFTTSIVDIIRDDLQDAVSHEHVDYDEFANGEVKVRLDQSVRGRHVYVIGDVNGNQKVKDFQIKYNDRLMQILLLMQCASNHGAKTVNVIPTCFPYSRQDKPIQ